MNEWERGMQKGKELREVSYSVSNRHRNSSETYLKRNFVEKYKNFRFLLKNAAIDEIFLLPISNASFIKASCRRRINAFLSPRLRPYGFSRLFNTIHVQLISHRGRPFSTPQVLLCLQNILS